MNQHASFSETVLQSAASARKVLLIGGAGYVGGPVAAYLMSQGKAVRALDLLVYGHQGASLGAMLNPAYEFIFGDMGDQETLDAALEGATDVVILGGLVGDPITKAYPDEAHRINDLAVRRCIDRLNGKGLRRVIFVSTCSNYGMSDEIATEETELKPLSLYAGSKVEAERYLLSLRGRVDYVPTVLRFSTAFGLSPRMRFDLTVNEFTRELYLDRELLVFDAHTWRPYCHVGDFSRLIDHVLDAAEQDIAFEVFNAGSDENNHTKQSIVDLIRDRLPDRRVTYRANSSDPRNYRVSFEKLRSRLGFECRYTVADGIDELVGALEGHLFDDVDERPNFFGNRELVRVST